MKVHLQYGREGLVVDLPTENVTILEPRFLPGLEDERGEFVKAVREPINSAPLREIVAPQDRVAIVIADITRPLPSDRLLPWILNELSHVPRGNFTIINGTGSHRANTPTELESMVGVEVARNYRIVNHDAHNRATLALAGKTEDGRELWFNRDYVEADKRIVVGFIEPHFMAGFSGGYKGIFPAVADIDSIMHYHRADVIGHPRSTWGVLDGNPTQEQIRKNASVMPVHFCVNVTLNRKREITRFFCGETLSAHEMGSAFAKATAMIACPQPFPIVVTTNSGFPLDQNLYQAVKGMSAAAQIVRPDGLIVAASRCNDGFPAHGNFRKLLFEHDSPEALLRTILAPGFSMYDQWEAQMLAMICRKARVGLHSEIDEAETLRAHLHKVGDIGARVAMELERIGKDEPVAVLPEGPMTIPYLEPHGASVAAD